jgi:hypothetical protein
MPFLAHLKHLLVFIVGEIKLYILHEKNIQQGVKDKNKLFDI